MGETLFQAQDALEPMNGRRSKMQSMNRNLLFGAFVVGTLALFVADVRAEADDYVQHLGPVGPHEPILTTFGRKRAIAFYEPSDGRCAVHAVVWENTDAETESTTAARVRVTLNPHEVVHIDSADNKTITLRCGTYAETLALIDNSNMITARASE